MIDPGLRLAAAVVASAVDDLRRQDPLVSLDALIWLTFGDGPIWLEALGLDVTPDEIFCSIVGRKRNGSVRSGRRLAGLSARYDPA
jgi:hypothetical protein